ncbi:MAG: hypothetical protein QOF76_4249 [Solirubrobacteraceae bacterium]|nr:hypothetical protein [Solirubrobacteraceae bacterium]
MPDLSELTVDDFSARAGESFALADGTVLTLVEATALPASPLAPRPPFALEFTGPPEVIYPQATYALSNEHLGTLEIFIVPTGRDEEAVHYQVIFG